MAPPRRLPPGLGAARGWHRGGALHLLDRSPGPGGDFPARRPLQSNRRRPGPRQTAARLAPRTAPGERRDAPGEFDHLLSYLGQHDLKGVVLASGDVHLGYLLHEKGRLLPGERMGPKLWELTSSPLANDTWSETVTNSGHSDRYLIKELESLDDGLVDVDLDRTGREIRLLLKDEGFAVLLERQSVLLLRRGVRLLRSRAGRRRRRLSAADLPRLERPLADRRRRGLSQQRRRGVLLQGQRVHSLRPGSGLRRGGVSAPDRGNLARRSGCAHRRRGDLTR